MKVPFCIPEITRQDKDAVSESLNSQWLTGGEKTVEFEKKFAEYVGVKYAVAVGNCTEALHLAMRAIGVKEGDEVIVPTLTFAATANASIFCGASPVFADIDENTMCLSPESVEANITEKTKAVVPVHYAGQSCDMYEILRLAMRYRLRVVEDCAHSLGATYENFQTGSLSDCGCFSMYPTKPITCGEGGMVTTNNKKLADYVRLMRSHCMSKDALERSKSSSWEYDIVGLGYNYRMTEMQASLGISQLSRVDEMNGKRAKIAEFYTERLDKAGGIIIPKVAECRSTSNHLYVIRIVEEEFGMNRNELFKSLAESGIECGIHYKPLHLMPFYQREFGTKQGDCLVAEKIYQQILSLPIYPKLEEEQMEHVVENIEALAK